MKHSGRTLIWFFTVVLTALVVKLFVLDILHVSGPSMLPALSHGKLVLEYKLAWGIPVPFTNRYLVRWGKPETGDIVIYPWLGRYVIKRCVATEGAPIVCSGDGILHISDKSILLTDEQHRRMCDTETVPEGMLFALGDNAAYSRDSRDYGFVSIDSIRGKALWR
jgi:signal peptidase I